MPERKNILITGVPGIGKTTLIMNLYHRLEHLGPVGFYTQEIRERGTRRGFEMVSFDDARGVLAHVDIKGQHLVGKYGVDIAAFEKFIGDIDWKNTETRLFIIDEIGKMECFSAEFIKLINSLLDSPVPLIATIALKGGGMIEAIKCRRDVEMYEINQNNRGRTADIITSAIESCRST